MRRHAKHTAVLSCIVHAWQGIYDTHSCVQLTLIAERLSARQLILRHISEIVCICLSIRIYVRTYAYDVMRALYTRKRTHHVCRCTSNTGPGSLDFKTCENNMDRGAVRNQSNRGVCYTGSLDFKTCENNMDRGVYCTLYAPRYFNRCTSNTGSYMDRGAIRNQNNRGVCCTLYAPRYVNQCSSNTELRLQDRRQRDSHSR